MATKPKGTRGSQKRDTVRGQTVKSGYGDRGDRVA
jgi:hypothetical protein